MKKNNRIMRPRRPASTLRIDKLHPAARPGWYKQFKQLLDKASRRLQ